MKKLGPNQPCGCGSGIKHKKCCSATRSAWYVDGQGRVMDQHMAMFEPADRNPLMEAYRRQHGVFPRKQSEVDRLIVEMDAGTLVAVLLEAGDHPARVYAIEKTGKFIPTGWGEWAVITQTIPRLRDGRTPACTDGMLACIEYLQVADPTIEAVELSTDEIARLMVQEPSSLLNVHGRECLCLPCRLVEASALDVLTSIMADDGSFRLDPPGYLFTEEIHAAFVELIKGADESSAMKVLWTQFEKATRKRKK